METLNPQAMVCTPGKVLVCITEVLGGMKKGVWTVAQDHGRKDTATGVVLKVGDPPHYEHFVHAGMRSVDVRSCDETWPREYPGIGEGDVVAFPRDVPRVFVWEDKRYAIIHLHEILFRADPGIQFEVVPWPMPK